MPFLDIGDLSEFPPLGARIVRTQAGDVAVFRTSTGELFALDDRCPHKGGPLSQGIVHGKRVTCPLHNWVIQLDSGEAVAPDSGCAHRHEVRVTNGVVQLKLRQRAAAAA